MSTQAQTSGAASRRLSTEENVPWLHVQEYLAQLSSTLCEAYAKSERTNGQRTVSSAINHVKSDQDCKDSEECVMKDGRPRDFPQLDGFVITKSLGEGSYAKCYLADSVTHGERCAIKVRAAMPIDVSRP